MLGGEKNKVSYRQSEKENEKKKKQLVFASVQKVKFLLLWAGKWGSGGGREVRDRTGGRQRE